MHLDKLGLVRKNFIKRIDLENGQLSVWRINKSDSFSVINAVEILQKVTPNSQKNNELEKLFSISVGFLRQPINIDSKRTRVFCVLDDCVVSDEEHHPYHAVVSLHRDDTHLDHSQNSEFFLFAYDFIVTAMLRGEVWAK